MLSSNSYSMIPTSSLSTAVMTRRVAFETFARAQTRHCSMSRRSGLTTRGDDR
jgi:hypothetical protein